MNSTTLAGWDLLRHGGLLLDAPRLQVVAKLAPIALVYYREQELRRQAAAFSAGNTDISTFVTFVLEQICGFAPGNGAWIRGSYLGAEWGRRTPTGDTVKPRHVWRGENGATLPIFLEAEKQVGIGRGRRTVSQVVQWLRSGKEQLALLTNGRQWRLIFAGLDYDAFCEWDTDLWFEEGGLSTQVLVLRTLISPQAFSPLAHDVKAPLLAAVLDSRKGQAELSAVLGERVREAVELLVQSHGQELTERCADIDASEIYRAAVRVVMRVVVVLFAESRQLLPKDNALYHGAYGINGLIGELEKAAARGGNRLSRSFSAWPRLLALFRLVHQGSHHPELPVPAYGGELFAASTNNLGDGLSRALQVFETAAFDSNRTIFSDREVHRLLEKVSRTRVRLQQGRQSSWVTVPVDFSDLSSEYIGILYEGLLDFELKTAPVGDPVIFLAIGNQPALPLSRLESMDDGSLASLLEKMKDTSSKDDGSAGEEEESEEENQEEIAEVEVNPEMEVSIEDPSDKEFSDRESSDDRLNTRTRAEQWAWRAVEAGKLIPRLRGAITPEKRRIYEETLSSKARQLVIRVVLPGEWFLIRWGGTRKGSGTFYTRPGLAVPTVQRTLRPLAYTSLLNVDDKPNEVEPISECKPKTPEEILKIRVCDPSCGSGTFPIAALRYLTDALFESVHFHGRIVDKGDRSVVGLLGASSSESNEIEELGMELIPCRPDDPSFEPRLKAVLKRYVVERCIYGVDFNPLAVELCRLSLWIETMDRTLPFSFLDHKVKYGNSLIGAWFDQFMHYPVMAWKNREGGDKGHNNGVHFEKGERGKAFKAFVRNQVAPDLLVLLEGRTLFSEDQLGQVNSVHGSALSVLSRLHNLPVHDGAERARLYQEELVGSHAQKSLKAAMDLWCACWFWPSEELEHAPLPTNFSNPSKLTRKVAERIAAENCFFHWELEFPDVFSESGAGFDAMLGNPPWDIAKPNSKEFFSNLDPLYRGLGKPESRQTELFENSDVEQMWLDYSEKFVAWSNFVKFSSNPYGDPKETSSADVYSIVRGKANDHLHEKWAVARKQSNGFSDSYHSFRNQGGSDLNLYKLFLEQMVRLLKPGGNLGVVLPASVYNDNGAGPLRRLLLEQCDLQWLFSFENREKIFPIDSRFRFCCLIATRGHATRFVKMAFSRRDLSDWDKAENFVVDVAKEDLNLFSPISNSIPEVENPQDLDVLRTIFAHGEVLGGEKAAAWGIKYLREYDMTGARRAGQYFATDEVLKEPTISGPGQWESGNKKFITFYTGKMISAFDFAFQRWESGHAIRAVWQPLGFCNKGWYPEFVTPIEEVKRPWRGGTRIVFRDISNATNERTMLAALIPAWPCGNKVPLIAEYPQMSIVNQLSTCCVLNSFAYDFVVRNRITGINLNKFILDETPVPDLEKIPIELSVIGARLSMSHEVFACAWIELLEFCPELSTHKWESLWAVDTSSRLELRAISDAIVAHLYGLTENHFRWILRDCDVPKASLSELSFRSRLPGKGFWRTGIGSSEHSMRRAWGCEAEFRLTNLAVIAFLELDKLKLHHKGDLLAAIANFAPISGEGGWRLPDRIRLSDYNLGQDSRAELEQELGLLLRREFPKEKIDLLSWDDCKRIAKELQILQPEVHEDLAATRSKSSNEGSSAIQKVNNAQIRLFGVD